ncbi:hypothetical protein [uncultured Jannaschia sp.]|uniref:hypothetical protein n=1 Tax=uncultured Jannaschia sp. TaxID=293347 RepID=UPI0026219F14|nr:hypothetical protein [uncultured Jannaschia sp.]
MFGLFRKKPSPQDEMIADIEQAMLKSFDRIEQAIADPEPLSRNMNVFAAIAAMTGAIRDTYPGVLIEDENIAFALADAHKSGRPADIDGLTGAIAGLVRRCPDRRSAKIDTMTWIIAPKLQAHTEA